jgi:hypothetical protein
MRQALPSWSGRLLRTVSLRETLSGGLMMKMQVSEVFLIVSEQSSLFHTKPVPLISITTMTQQTKADVDPTERINVVVAKVGYAFRNDGTTNLTV